MRVSIIFALAAATSFAACKSRSNSPDNTAHNKDPITRANGDKAAQSGTDLDLTQKVRKTLVEDDTLSTNAHNVKVVAEGGVVTLTGPVDNDTERTKVVQLASAAGATGVVDHLEIVR